jgi:hypothetical protein
LLGFPVKLPDGREVEVVLIETQDGKLIARTRDELPPAQRFEPAKVNR